MATNGKRELRHHLAEFDSAMLVTRDPSGHPRARPMAIADRSTEGDLWFVTSAESGKVEELEHDPWVAVTMQAPHMYLSITGRAEVIDDRRQLDDLWRPSMKAWFAEGKDDPRLVIVRVTGERAEYWGDAGVIEYAFEAARAIVKGHRPPRGRREHGEVALHRPVE